MNRIKKTQLAEIVIHILFWIAVFYTLNSLNTTAIRFRVNSNGGIIEGEELHTLLPLSIITLSFLAILFYSNIFWLFRKILSFRNSIARLVVAGGWFLLLFWVNDIIMALITNNDHFNSPPFPPKPPHPGLPDAPHHSFPVPPKLGFSLDVLNRSQFILLLIFLSVMGASIAYFFLKEWAKADLSRNQLQANQLSTEIKFLKSQINPHFLFNTLNNLFSMAQEKGNDDLADGISKLSGMMRYMIYESNAEKVPLTDEIAYIKNCIALNKLRYADEEAEVTFKYPDQIQSVLIAPMLFIPFIENAFKHGVLINQPSQIDIAIAVSDRQLLFTCENKNYSFVKKMDDHSGGIGLENVKRRLEMVYPGKCELFIKNDEDQYVVKLKINLE